MRFESEIETLKWRMGEVPTERLSEMAAWRNNLSRQVGNIEQKLVNGVDMKTGVAVSLSTRKTLTLIWEKVNLEEILKKSEVGPFAPPLPPIDTIVILPQGK